jgi:GNAT superfamily N-acetyltransferase
METRSADDEGSMFASALTRAYLSAPGEVLPNALWKTMSRLDDCETSFSQQPDGTVTHLEIWQTDRLILYWDAARRWVDIPARRLERLNFALVHQHYLDHLAVERFHNQRAYFRLSFRGLALPARLPEGFHFITVQLEEAAQAAEVIGQCYEDIQPSVDSVRAWALHPVYDPRLWVWVWDEAKDTPASLGIAELDRSIGEGSLEWIQVLPEYRGFGLGQAIVLELLRRMEGKASFVTVSGEVDNRTQPERLYRRCGFTGKDIWWLLS